MDWTFNQENRNAGKKIPIRKEAGSEKELIRKAGMQEKISNQGKPEVGRSVVPIFLFSGFLIRFVFPD
jgi:hypothetical protein